MQKSCASVGLHGPYHRILKKKVKIEAYMDHVSLLIPKFLVLSQIFYVHV